MPAGSPLTGGFPRIPRREPPPPPKPQVPLEAKDLKEVYDICKASGWGNCAELAATAAVQTMNDLSGKYPNIKVQVAYEPGHAYTLVDFNGDGVADGYVDPWKKTTGKPQDLPTKPVHTTPWFGKDDFKPPAKPPTTPPNNPPAPPGK